MAGCCRAMLLAATLFDLLRRWPNQAGACEAKGDVIEADETLGVAFSWVLIVSFIPPWLSSPTLGTPG